MNKHLEGKTMSNIILTITLICVFTFIFLGIAIANTKMKKYAENIIMFLFVVSFSLSIIGAITLLII